MKEAYIRRIESGRAEIGRYADSTAFNAIANISGDSHGRSSGRTIAASRAEDLYSRIRALKRHGEKDTLEYKALVAQLQPISGKLRRLQLDRRGRGGNKHERTDTS